MMNIRSFNPITDMARILALYQTCFAEAPWNERFNEVELEAEFREILTWFDSIFLVETDDDDMIIGGAIGYNVCRKSDVCEMIALEDSNGFYVAELFVDPKTRAKQVCTRLNALMLKRAALRGYDRMVVRTSINQPAIKHLFVDKLRCKVVASQDVMSTKWIDDVEQQVPDTRILMVGDIPYRRGPEPVRDPMFSGCFR